MPWLTASWRICWRISGELGNSVRTPLACCGESDRFLNGTPEACVPTQRGSPCSVNPAQKYGADQRLS
jgi:hypothetical protein